MKGIKVAIVSSIAFMALFSCTSPLSSRMNKYVSNVESKSKDWSSDDWKLSQEEYSKLLKEYEEHYDSYTKEEKEQINKAIGRYNGLLIKQGLNEAGNVLKEIGEQIPSLIQGFVSAFEETEK